MVRTTNGFSILCCPLGSFIGIKDIGGRYTKQEIYH